MTENLEQGAKSKLKFFPALEGLRGFAAIIVTLFHMKWDSHFFHLGLIRNGYLFVDFFFLLLVFNIFIFGRCLVCLLCSIFIYVVLSVTL